MSPPNNTARAAWLRALERTAAIERDPGTTLPLLVEDWALRFGAATALSTKEGEWSYLDLAGACNRYARWGLAAGLAPGDVVGLLMENCIEYPAIWLGLGRLGVAVALLNVHLEGEALAHSIGIAAPRCVIAGTSLAARLHALRPRLPRDLRLFVHGVSTVDMAPLAADPGDVAGERLRPEECAAPSLDRVALYIYTSGTTGLPKAARVSHYRVMQWSHWFAGLMDTGPADRMYNCLPLYHSVGGVVATGATLVGGGAVVIRRRFSAEEFWHDLRAERCTLFQYIGELCRYLLNAAAREGDGDHALRIACGNGLRADVWTDFQQRFRIPQILEYYASTEGNFSLYNCEGRVGSIGRVPSFLSHRLPIALVRFDPDHDVPWRNAAGFCERVAADETGEALGRLPPDDATRAGRFEGYADALATEAKILRNVFETGDRWYRTGDLMRRDAQGFYYFVDRVGDTFRWKGENVSTLEVRAALAAARGVCDAIVYGVEVPGADGRAGMAALVVDDGFDLTAFRAHVQGRLPAYARPVFLRLLTAIESTATFKPRARALATDGFDPARTTDPLYVDDRRLGAYVPINAALLTAIRTGALRL